MIFAEPRSKAYSPQRSSLLQQHDKESLEWLQDSVLLVFRTHGLHTPPYVFMKLLSKGVSPERPLSLVVVFLAHAVLFHSRHVLQGSSASQGKRVVVLDMNLTTTTSDCHAILRHNTKLSSREHEKQTLRTNCNASVTDQGGHGQQAQVDMVEPDSVQLHRFPGDLLF